MFDAAIDALGEQNVLGLGGLSIGLGFGVLAERSKFCLGAAAREAAFGAAGKRLAIWMLVFGAALAATQSLYLMGWFDSGAVRVLNNRSSLSGAIIGGLCFGCGITVAGGCASRILIKTATGDLRALLTWLAFAFIALISRGGALTPLRDAIANAWTINSDATNLLSIIGQGHGGGALIGCAFLAAAGILGFRQRMAAGQLAVAAFAGFLVAAAWCFNFTAAANMFEVAPVHSLSFTGPSADFLAIASSSRGANPSFDLGLIPGVALGAFFAAAKSGGWGWRGFRDVTDLVRAVVGGALMGFGGMLAGGCEIGAGMSGASVFAMGPWVALAAMWVGSMAACRLVADRSFGG